MLSNAFKLDFLLPNLLKVHETFREYRLQIWDLLGQQRFSAVREVYRGDFLLFEKFIGKDSSTIDKVSIKC